MMFDNNGNYHKGTIDGIFEIWSKSNGEENCAVDHFRQDFLDDVWDFAYSLTYKDKTKGKGVRKFLDKNKELREERGRHQRFAAECLLKTVCYLLDRINRKERYGRYY